MIRRKTQKARRQRGGATPMPLGYYKDGAQMYGTVGSPTGVGIGSSSGAWVRAPIVQTGGFAPQIMGPFAANGLKYLPTFATYTGYKMWKHVSKPRTRKQKRRTGRSGRRV